MSCDYFERQGITTLSEAAWRRVHEQHLQPSAVFTRERHLHSVDKMVWLVCTCEARLLIIEHADGERKL